VRRKLKVVPFIRKERIADVVRFEKWLVRLPRINFVSVTPDLHDQNLYHLVVGKMRGKPEVADDALRVLIDRFGPQFLTDRFKYDLMTVLGESNATSSPNATAGEEGGDGPPGPPELPTLPAGGDN
jgi:hypothetical protein